MNKKKLKMKIWIIYKQKDKKINLINIFLQDKINLDENMMIMVAANPDNSELLFEIGQNVSYDIRFYVGIARDICDAVKEYYDKADTQDVEEDEDLRQEHLLVSEFHKMEDEENLIVYPSDSNEAPYSLFNDQEDSSE